MIESVVEYGLKNRKGRPMSDLAGTIGAVAKQAGVGVETIRYYQRIGLVREPARPAKARLQVAGECAHPP
jgi:hypothetical protein